MSGNILVVATGKGCVRLARDAARTSPSTEQRPRAPKSCSAEGKKPLSVQALQKASRTKPPLCFQGKCS